MYEQSIYPFGPITNDTFVPDKSLQGGKGANLIEMSSLGLPVPPGFTLSTELCHAYSNGDLDFERMMDEDVLPLMEALRGHFGYLPLVAVRSGAPISMPGMMDTVLNVGLTKGNLPEWKERIGEWSALDCYRRLLQMYGETVLGIPGKLFQKKWREILSFKYGLKKPPAHDGELTIKHLNRAIELFEQVYEKRHVVLPDEPEDQYRLAIAAVFESWNTERAKQYRKANGISEDLGTAVNIVSMVFGNMDDQSCSGVAFTRCPSTGEPKPVGEFLPKAQGEDVVAGIRTPYALADITEWHMASANHLAALMAKLEQHYGDVQDIEFTVQSGALYLLQTRAAKRSARAAFRIAVDLYEDGTLDQAQALKTIDRKHLNALSQTIVDPEYGEEPDATGLGAAGGLVSGYAATTHGQAKQLAGQNKPVIYVADDTSPDDFEVMQLSAGILTRTGGITSHAAVVARGMNLTCVVGCADLGNMLAETWIAIDGMMGRVWIDKDVPSEDMTDDPYVAKVLAWAKAGKTNPTLVDLGVDPLPHDEKRLRVSFMNMDMVSVSAELDKLVKKNPALEELTLDGRLKQDLMEDDEYHMAYTVMGLDENEEDPYYRANRHLHLMQAVVEVVDTDRIWIVPSAYMDKGLLAKFRQDLPDHVRFEKQITSVAEVLSHPGPFQPSQALIEQLGGTENYARFLDMLAAYGVEQEVTGPARKERSKLFDLFTAS